MKLAELKWKRWDANWDFVRYGCVAVFRYTADDGGRRKGAFHIGRFATPYFEIGKTEPVEVRNIPDGDLLTVQCVLLDLLEKAKGRRENHQPDAP